MFRRLVVGPLLVWVSGTAFADCDTYSHLKDKKWVDGDCMETPLGERWWPHPRWGEGDEAGSTNWYSQPEVVNRALAMVKEGRVQKIGQDYQTEMPLFGARQFTLRIPGSPTGGVLGANRVIWMDEFLATEVSQVGTQFDGLGHIGVATGSDGDKEQMRFYNGFTGQEILDPYGLKRLGAEKLNPIIARGVLIDVATARGVESMEAGEVITMNDVRAALRRQGLADFELKPGDAVLFRTGWQKYWIEDNEKYNAGCPGIGMEVARWLARYVASGCRAESRSGLCVLRSHLPPDATRNCESGEPESGNTRCRGGVSVRVYLHACSHSRRNWLNRIADSHVVTENPFQVHVKRAGSENRTSGIELAGQEREI
jgi:hypothetical protein